MSTEYPKREIAPASAVAPDRASLPEPTGEEHAVPHRTGWQRLVFAVRLVEVRLRFVLVLAAIGAIVGYWDTLQNHWDRWTRPAVTAAGHVDDGTEFYCPMHPSVTRPGLEANGAVPQCPICGMPLSKRKKGGPVELAPGVLSRVQLSPDRVRLAGLRTSEVALRPLRRSIRTVGNVTYDESRRARIVTRVDGYLEKLFVNQSFVEVHQGDPLAEIYSPELYAAVQELLISKKYANGNLIGTGREKLELLGVDDREIDDIINRGNADYRLVLRSPEHGLVIRKEVLEGDRVTAGQMLFEVADRSTVWIEADVFEKDIAAIEDGQAVEATVDAYPDTTFHGTVALVYPELQARTRTNRVRFEVANPTRLLRAGMYATVRLETPVNQIEPFKTRLAALHDAAATDDVAQIALQQICPVTGLQLGTMGDPVRAVVGSEPVYLCCANCTDAMNENPDYYLARTRTVTDEGVLAVPERAVIDTGEATIVYVEREPGTFEGVEVTLGSRSDGHYAVISGLLPGDRVAENGAFLIDAETRLNPAAASAYFGASGGRAESQPAEHVHPPPAGPPDARSNTPIRPTPSTTPASPKRESNPSAQLPAADRMLIEAQGWCPVTNLPLGAMGAPLKISINGEDLFVCCKACEERARKDAADVLEKVKQWRAASSAAVSRGTKLR